MRKRIGIILLAAFAVVVATSQGRETRVFPFDYRAIELENGFKAYLIKTDSSGQISYVTVVRAGSRDESEKGKSGYAHFFEHMMFRGTVQYPQYDEIIGKIGALSNAATSDDFTHYYVLAANDALEQIVDLESDRFINLKYTESAFRTEAGAILGEFSQTRNNPYNFLFTTIQDTAFEQHPYKHLTIGLEQDIRQMPEGYAYSLSFYRRYYRPENCVLLLAGDFDFNHAETLIRRYYAPWKSGYKPAEIETEPEQISPRRVNVTFPGGTLPMLSVDYKGPAWSATDRKTVAAQVLGMAAFGTRSDLYKKLIIRDRKAQSLMVEFGLKRDPGLLEVMAVVSDPSDLSMVEYEIGETVARFRKDLCDADLIEDIKQAIKYEFLMNMETPQGVCSALRPVVTFTGSIEAMESYWRTLESVTSEDVRAAAKIYLIENGKNTVTLVSAGEAE